MTEVCIPIAEVPNPRKVYLEVGLGIYRENGYSADFPFEADDVYWAMDLMTAKGVTRYGFREPRPISLSGAAVEKAFGYDLKEESRRALSWISQLATFAESKKINLFPVYADGAAIPLFEGQADEVLFSNVIGDPGIHNVPKKMLIKEAARVLKTGGRIVISECYTPQIAADFFRAFHNDSLEIAHFDKNSSDWSDLRTRYSSRHTYALGRQEFYIITPKQ